MFLDDLHLMPDRRVARFLCELAARLPDNVHLIAASRDKALSGDQVLRLGGRLHRIGAGQLRLEGDELAAYAHRFGAALDREQLAELQQATEGWMAAVYLHLQALADRGPPRRRRRTSMICSPPPCCGLCRPGGRSSWR